MKEKTHVIIIGGGIGGYTAALEVCRRGMQATLIEENKWGGTCLQRGCIPMKFLLDRVHREKEKELSVWQREKEEIITELTFGLRYRLEKAGIDLVSGRAVVTEAEETIKVSVTSDAGAKQEIAGDILILAAGAHTILPNVLSPWKSRVWTADDIMAADTFPESVLLLGAGISGIECGEYLASLGVQVHILEQEQQILPGWDGEIAEEICVHLEDDLGVQCHTGCSAVQMDSTDAGYLLTIEDGDKKRYPLEVERVAACTSKTGNVSGMGLEKWGILDENSRKIVVDDCQRTKNPRIYAVGDCTMRGMAAHTAVWDAKRAAAAIDGEIVKDARPKFAFLSTQPSACRAGMTLEDALKAGWDAAEGRVGLYGNGRAAVLGQSQGMVKIVADKESRRILGFHMAGAWGEELLSLGTFLVQRGCTLDEVTSMAFPHPAVAECIQEAADRI